MVEKKKQPFSVTFLLKESTFKRVKVFLALLKIYLIKSHKYAKCKCLLDKCAVFFLNNAFDNAV